MPVLLCVQYDHISSIVGLIIIVLWYCSMGIVFGAKCVVV